MNVKIGVLNKEQIKEILDSISKDESISIDKIKKIAIKRAEEVSGDNEYSEVEERMNDLLSDNVAIDKMKEVTGKDAGELFSLLQAHKNVELGRVLQKSSEEDLLKSEKVSNAIMAAIKPYYPKGFNAIDVLSVNLAVGVASISINEMLIEANNDATKNKACKHCKCGVSLNMEKLEKAYKVGEVEPEVIAKAVYDGLATLEEISEHFGDEVASKVLSIASKWLEERK